MADREKEFLHALQTADEALYELWKLSPIDSDLMLHINRLQKEFIHPEIRKLDPKLRNKRRA